jgi:glutamate-1-semialdehyde 2,1-aminomutase
MRFERSAALRRKAHEVIPGGAHTYAKGDDQFPERSPGFIARGQGCRVWDEDGNEFVEYGMGLRAVALGHAFPPVVEAVRRVARTSAPTSRARTRWRSSARRRCSPPCPSPTW